MIKKLFSFILLLIFFSGISLSAHAQVVVEKSDSLRVLQGKMYYIHLVEPGQTLYSISKAYDLPVDEIIYENPDAKDGLRAFQTLRIPRTSRDVDVDKELRAGEFEFIYHIARGDESADDIASIYSLTTVELKAVNPAMGDIPRQGKYIKIPVKKEVMEVEKVKINVSLHVVQPKETFYSISRKYNVSIDELKDVNPDVPYPVAGADLYIPVKAVRVEPEKEAIPYFEYAVVKGETLYGISKKFQVEMDSIRQYNPGLVSELSIGQVLKIPFKKNTNDFITHRVTEKRTSLRKLAKKYAVSIEGIQKMNPRLESRLTYSAQVRIPVDPDALPYEVDQEESEKEDTLAIVIAAVPVPRPDKCGTEGNLNRTYKVALMLPLFLEELDKEVEINADNVEEYLPYRFIQFYQGAMMAVDDLKKQGLNLELYIYDVDQHISKTIRVLQLPELPSMDLIIGPFFRTSFKYAANFAELFGISIVNPLSRRPEILDGNPYTIKIQPSVEAENDLIMDLVSEHYATHKIIIIRPNKYQNEEDVLKLKGGLSELVDKQHAVFNSIIKNTVVEMSLADTTLEPDTYYESIMVENNLVYTEQLDAEPEGKMLFNNDVTELIYAVDSVYGIIKHASIVRPNLVIALADEEVSAIEIMTALNEVKDTFDISLIGLSDWSRFENLEVRYLLNFNTNIFAPSYINYEDAAVQDFIGQYRKNYLTEPFRFAFEGYDISYYFISALMKYGPDFRECLYDHNPSLIQTSFEFDKKLEGGYENIHWNVYRYHNYRIDKRLFREE